MQILDGKTSSRKILDFLKKEISYSPNRPNLDIILIGSDPASLKYCQMKQKTAGLIGVGGRLHRLQENVDNQTVIKLVNQLNRDPSVTGLFIQLPLPSHLDTNLIVNSVNPQKDVDGLTAENLGRLFQKDRTAIISATPLGIVKLLHDYKINLSGKNAVIVGRSPYIGLPLVALLEQRNATVTLCHSHTKNLSRLCSQADILITSIGQSKFFTSKLIKQGSVVIDIGTNYDQNGKVTGDVDFDNVKNKTSFITPVPGGVGPMTIASLLFNVVNVWKSQDKDL